MGVALDVPATCAIESASGLGYLLAQQLVAAGEFVVDVPSTLSARVRVLDPTRSQKNDANDARSVAIVALRQPGLRVVTAEDHVAVLRMLAKRHKQLAGLKTQAAARLHAELAVLIPGGLGKEMVARQAAGLLRRVRPASMVEAEPICLEPIRDVPTSEHIPHCSFVNRIR